MNAADRHAPVADQPAGSVVAPTGDLAPAFVPISEAARFLGISPATAYRLADASEFPVPVVRIGRSLRVSVAALTAFAASAA
jgi:excisionase family DNA binding protein